jgi:hypothetical protein
MLFISFFQHYGQEEPPLWHVSKVNVPVSTYFGLNDWLSAKEVRMTTLCLNVTKQYGPNIDSCMGYCKDLPN